ncbi:MAG TPA: hypothetical protein VK057_04020 [Bacillota bacterium]|nr:hypothetical protein [Bacillota bacterium]
MFQSNFVSELARRIGDSAEIATNNNLFEGRISSVSTAFVVVLSTNDGYGESSRFYIPVSTINFARFA